MRHLSSSWTLLVAGFLIHSYLLAPVLSIPTPQVVGEVSAVYDLIDRVLGSTTTSHPFHLKLTTKKSNNEKLFFQLEDDSINDGEIQITGTTANELSAGVGWYLRHYCNMTIGWPRGGGSHIVIPEQWPKIGAVVKKKRQFPWSYLMVSKKKEYS